MCGQDSKHALVGKQLDQIRNYLLLKAVPSDLRARILVGQEDLLDIHGRWDEFGGVVRPVSPINSVAALGPAFDRDPNRLDITKEQID